MIRLVGFSDIGRRCGQSHPQAKITDRDVELMRQLHEQFGIGHPDYWGIKKLSKKFEVPARTVRDIISYRYRMEPTTYRRVRVTRH